MKNIDKVKNLVVVNSYLDEIENYDKYLGALAGIVGLLIVFTIINLNIVYVWSWEVGFIDPSTAFAEALIRLYNFVWSFLFLILTVVLVLMVRIIYLFNWNSILNNSFIINKILNFGNNFILGIGFTIHDKKLIENSLIRLNELNKDSKELNVWYSSYDKKEFLVISDLSEYKRLEFIWCILPAIVLALIAGPSFSLVFSLDSSVDPKINIKVVGKQWYWVYSFDNILENEFYSYNFDSVMISEDDLTKGMHRLLEVDNRLVLPVGVPIRFIITSTDVLHSWAIPSLSLKVDAIPGRLNQFVLEIKKPGIFYGQCSELCGPMHGFMPITVQAISYNDYIDYLKNI